MVARNEVKTKSDFKTKIILSDNEIRDITNNLKKGFPLSEEYRFLLFDDKREVELVWHGKSGEVTNVVLPFQIIEQVDEPRREKDSGEKQLTLIGVDDRGRQLSGWTNIVKKTEKDVFIVETKGREDLDDPLKIKRLKQWCEDINKIQKKIKYDFVYVDEESYDKYSPKNFGELERSFKEYKN